MATFTFLKHNTLQVSLLQFSALQSRKFVITSLLKRTEPKRWREKLVYSRWLNLSNEPAYKKLINCNKIAVLRNLGNFYTTSNTGVKNKDISRVCWRKCCKNFYKKVVDVTENVPRRTLRIVGLTVRNVQYNKKLCQALCSIHIQGVS
jgi:hypothetical protein